MVRPPGSWHCINFHPRRIGAGSSRTCSSGSGPSSRFPPREKKELQVPSMGPILQWFFTPKRKPGGNPIPGCLIPARRFTCRREIHLPDERPSGRRRRPIDSYNLLKMQGLAFPLRLKCRLFEKIRRGGFFGMRLSSRGIFLFRKSGIPAGKHNLQGESHYRCSGGILPFGQWKFRPENMKLFTNTGRSLSKRGFG